MSAPTLDSSKFVRITYLIDLGTSPQEVKGYAFETPGWPEWRACVRYGNRWGDDIFEDWIVDHFDTGYALSVVGHLNSMKEAPEAMAKALNRIGRETVLKRLSEFGVSAPTIERAKE